MKGYRKSHVWNSGTAKKIMSRCRHCGKEFEQRRKDFKDRIPKFCSMRCWYDSRRAIAASRPAKQTRERHASTCRECGVQFVRKPSEVARKFCTAKCKAASQRRIASLVCATCGASFGRQVSSRRGKKTFCSRACQSKGMSDANSPLFRGNRKQYRGATWKEQSALARVRDENACQCGGTEKTKISVDHIVPFRLAKQYGDANVLMNLVCLCRSCHAKKTRIEAMLLAGDVVGFMQRAKTIIAEERVRAALVLFSLVDEHHHI